MKTAHKNKTTASLLAMLLGGLGLHRFYLHGRRDLGAWLYLGATGVYVCLVTATWLAGTLGASVLALFPLPVFIALIEALAIGVTIDESWDARHNLYSGYRSRSQWPLVVLLVLTLAGGFVALIASMARATDLLLTGGSFG